MKKDYFDPSIFYSGLCYMEFPKRPQHPLAEKLTKRGRDCANDGELMTKAGETITRLIAALKDCVDEKHGCDKPLCRESAACRGAALLRELGSR